VRQLVGAELHPGRDDRPQNHGSQPAGPNNQSGGCSERDPHGKPGKQTGPDLADLGEQDSCSIGSNFLAAAGMG